MTNLYSELQQSIARFGPLPALYFRRRYRTLRWTFDDLDKHIKNIAEALLHNQIHPGDKILLFGGNSPYWVAAYYAIIARGAIVIPLNPQSPPQQLERIVSSSEPKLLLHTANAVWPGPVLHALPIEQAAEIQWSGGQLPELRTGEQDLAEIVYTSGTTGIPKGIMLTHGNLLSGIRMLPDAIPLQPGTAVMSIVPLFHLYGQMAGMLYPLHSGAGITYLPALSSRVIRSTLRHTPAEFLVAVPEFLKTFMDRLEENLAGWPRLLRYALRCLIRRRISTTLHTLISGGAPLPPDLEKKWRDLGFAVLQGYGLTETSPMISINTAVAHRSGSVGKPLPGVQVKIAEDGEILVKGPNVMQGYFQDDARTNAVLQADWLKTDDSGKFDSDGFLYVFGRKKYMILGPGGENVFPEDLEAELNSIPEVRDSAVIGLPHEGRTVIHAVLLSDSDNGESIVRQANRHLAPHQQIVSWSLWPEADFPRSATRKVKKQELLKRISAGAQAAGKTTTPVTPLIRVIAHTTNSDPAAIHDQTRLVSDLKLDSLLRIELVGRIEEEFNVELAENQITAETTVAELQSLIRAHSPQPSSLVQYPRWSLSRWCSRLRPFLQDLLFACLPMLGSQRIHGLQNLLGLKQPVIFMANHRSYLDPLIAPYAIPRRFRKRLGIAAAINPLYEKFWWSVPFAELVMNAYPLSTRLSENIKPSLEYTGRLLDDDWNVLIFPEGQMNRTDSALLPLKGGAGVLAVEMQATIIPLAISGTDRILPPGKLIPRKRGVIDIRFGTPLSFKETEDYVNAVQAIEKALRNLIVRSADNV